MNCIVTGGSGYLGSALIKHLLSKSLNVINFDKINSGNTNVPGWLITRKGLYAWTIKTAFQHRSRIASGNLEDITGTCISTRPKTQYLPQSVNRLGQKSGSPFGFGAPPRNSYI